MSRVAAAILAGGGARRVGSDKALAAIGGVPMIDVIAARLAVEVDTILICGRSHGAFPWVADRPATGLGPLGGLAAALHWASGRGFDRVLSVPCDTPHLPADLLWRLSMGDDNVYADDCPVIGLWDTAGAAVLDALLAAPGRHAMRDFIDAVGARPCALGRIANVNTPGDLARITAARNTG